MYEYDKIENSKDLIKAFMKEKDQILFDIMGIHLYCDDDFEDVDNWDDGVCKKMELDVRGDSQCCPSCIKYDMSCYKCKYGAIHGKCMENNSHYKVILYKLYTKKGVKAFCLLKSIENLIDDFNYKQELLRLGADNIGKFNKYIL